MRVAYRAWSVILAGLLAISAGLVGVSAARADVNSGIKVTLESFSQVTETGSPLNTTQLYVGDFVNLAFKYNAANANVKAGDSFVVTLPPEFKNRDSGTQANPVLKDMIYTDPAGIEYNVGQCAVLSQTITCTFNDKVAGKVIEDGSITAMLAAATTTTKTEVTADFNGVSTPLVIPGDNGIAIRSASFTQVNRATKGSHGVGSNSTGVNWTFNIGGKWLAENYPNGGPVTIKDVLPDDKLVFSANLADIWLSRATPATNGRFTEQRIADATGVTNGTFTISADISQNRSEAVIIINKNGLFSPDENFEVTLRTFTSDGQTILKGWDYTNNATFVETGYQMSATRSYFESFVATANLRDKFGSFRVTKGAGGTGEMADGQTFKLKVSYVLPDPPPIDYATWTDRPSNPAELLLRVGYTSVFPNGLPAGTIVTLTEDVSTADPAAGPNTRWGDPVFKSSDSRVKVAADGKSATFTIVDQQVIPVTITNNAIGLNTFSVTKIVEGSDADAYQDQDFVFNYTCSDGQKGAITASAADGVVEAGQRFDVGTTCEVTEADSSRPGYTLTVPEKQTVTISATSVANLTFKNVYSKDLGTFSIKKNLVDGGSAGSDQFSVSYVCSAAGVGVAASGDVTVTAGTPTEVGKFPVGTKCEVKAEADAARAGYTLTTDLGSAVTIAKDATATVEVTNTYSKDLGTFAINKTVVANGAQAPSSFSVSYVCSAAGVGVAASGDVTVTAGTPTEVGKFPVGATCQVVGEDQKAAAVADYTLGTAYGDPVTVVKDQTATAEVTNTYVRDLGGLTIVKEVKGDGAALAPAAFSFTYTCTGKDPVTVEVEAGKPLAIAGVETGDCIVTEADASVAKADLATTWSIDGMPVDQATVKVVKGQNVEVRAVNEYTLQRGTFSIVKKVSPAGELANRTFDFTYTCSDGSTGTAQVAGDGTAWTSEKLPLGTSCDVAEVAASAQVDGYSVKLPDAQSVTIQDKDSNVELVFENSYTANPTPVPSAPSSSKPAPTPSQPEVRIMPSVKPGLPKTGAEG